MKNITRVDNHHSTDTQQLIKSFEGIFPKNLNNGCSIIVGGRLFKGIYCLVSKSAIFCITKGWLFYNSNH